MHSHPAASSSEALYTDYLYEDYPITASHPSRLAALGTLLGLNPAPPTQCRVLELGCGLGGNLVPMACALPASRFVGIDLSAAQIAVGQQDVKALGLRNIRLIAGDLLDVEPDLGTFDYILCHGVYSWVPEPVRQRILEICGACLAPQGIAYISYNALPGWHLRGALRQMLQRVVGEQGSPAERVARARDFLTLFEHLPVQGSREQTWLKGEVDILKGTLDPYVYYEHLVEVNDAFYLSDFMGHAASFGLKYLADAEDLTMRRDRYGAAMQVLAERANGDVVAVEQDLDLLDICHFRSTLLCRESAEPNREIDWRRLTELWISTQLQPTSAQPDVHSERAETFRSKGGVLTTALPLLKAILVALVEERPRGLAFPELCARVGALPGVVGPCLASLLEQGLLELSAWVPSHVTTPSATPESSALLRRQARSGRGHCTNFRHENVELDRFDQAVLQRLDGTRTWNDIADAVTDEVRAGHVVIEVDGMPSADRALIEEILEQKLHRMARAALLVR